MTCSLIDCSSTSRAPSNTSQACYHLTITRQALDTDVVANGCPSFLDEITMRAPDQRSPNPTNSCVRNKTSSRGGTQGYTQRQPRRRHGRSISPLRMASSSFDIRLDATRELSSSTLRLVHSCRIVAFVASRLCGLCRNACACCFINAHTFFVVLRLG